MISSIQPISSQEHIKNLYDQVKNEEWRKEAFRTANFANGSLKGLFINELLQNADDANATTIELSLVNHTFTIIHNGRNFGSNDVKKIASFADQEILDKSKNKGNAGYKGIGFKGILSLARRVDIFSGDYSFKFDEEYWKHHPDWKGQNIPWQRIPIWIEHNTHQQDKTVLIFELIHADKVKEQLEDLCKDPSTILFLRNVKIIEISLGQDKPKFAIRAEEKAGQRTLFVDNMMKNEWEIKHAKIEIPLELQKMIKAMDDHERPIRLTDNASTEITFAFPKSIQNKNKNLSNPEAEIFSTLPTKIKLGLPFAVNAEFILDLRREYAVVNLWNEYLFKLMAYAQFLFLKEFATGTRWKSLLHILGPATIFGVDSKLQIAYAQGYAGGLVHFEWLPSFIDPKKLLKLSGSKLDLTGFYSKFKDSIPANVVPKNLVHTDLENMEKLASIANQLKIPITVLDQQYIANQLEHIFKETKDLKLCYNILVFFQENHWNWDDFKDKSWIPTADLSLGKLSSLHLPQEEKFDLPPIKNDYVIHHDIFLPDDQHILRNWLKSQDVRALKLSDLADKIVKVSRNHKISVEQNEQLIRYLFDLYVNDSIDDEDFEVLKDMHVLNKKGTLSLVTDLYISKAYDPHQQPDLEELFPNSPALFLYEFYPTSKDQVSQWLEFFHALGAHTKCELRYIESKETVGNLKKHKIAKLDDYFDHLKEYPPIIGDLKQNHAFNHFIFFPGLNNLTSQIFAKAFWKTLGEQSKQFIRSDKKCTFICKNNDLRELTSRKYQKSSYIKFMLNTYDLIKGTDGIFHRMKDLYSPQFIDLKDDLLVADIETPLASELIEYLGFKTKISLEDCFNFLNRMRIQRKEKLPVYTTIIQNITAGWNALEEEADKEKLLKKDWYFYAQNNSWQPVANLKYLDIKGINLPQTSDRYFKNVSDEIKVIAEIFKCTVVTQCVDPSKIMDPKEDEKIRQDLYKKLPQIAWKLAHHRMSPIEEMLKMLIERMKNLKIFLATSIPFLDNAASQIPVERIGDHIYYSTRCVNYKLHEKIAEFFGFNQQETSDTIEILSKTPDDWIQENYMPQELLKQLNPILNQSHEVLSNPVSIQATPTLTGTPRPPEDSSLTITPPSKKQKLDGSSESGNKNSSGSNQVDLLSPQNSTPTPKSSENSRRTPATKQLFTTPDKEFNPKVPFEQIKAKQQIIKKLEPSGDDKSSKDLINPGSAKKSGPSKRSFSDDAEKKRKIGRWGEKMVFMELIEHFKRKHKVEPIEQTEGHCKLVGERVEFVITWLNYKEETTLNRDIDVTKTIKNKTPFTTFTYPVEVKASKGPKVRFFLSENEWDLMQRDPKYRLYYVKNAGGDEAEMLKIPKPKKWLSQVNIAEHKTYEVTNQLKTNPEKMEIDLTHREESNDNARRVGQIVNEPGKMDKVNLSTEIVEKINKAQQYLQTHGFVLKEVQADGNSYLNAFLESYDRLPEETRREVDLKDRTVAFLRKTIADRFAIRNKSTGSLRAQEIRREGHYIASDVGELLAIDLHLNIRILTVSSEGLFDMLTYVGFKRAKQEWNTILLKPKEYIFIVDLGDRFYYAVRS